MSEDFMNSSFYCVKRIVCSESRLSISAQGQVIQEGLCLVALPAAVPKHGSAITAVMCAHVAKNYCGRIHRQRWARSVPVDVTVAYVMWLYTSGKGWM